MNIAAAAASVVAVGLFAFLSFPTEDAEAASMTFTTNTTITTDHTIAGGETWTIDPGVTITVPLGVTITNIGEFDNFGTIDNTGGIHNHKIINNNGIIINNNSIVNTSLSGTINNNGTINNIDSIFNFGATINNYGTLDNDNYIDNDGPINNYGTFNNDNLIQNYATITNNLGGTINNSGNFDNEGTTDNYGTFINSGHIGNLGPINNKCGATFINTGTIFKPINNETCYLLNLFEGSDPSDLVYDLGQEAKAVAETNDINSTLVTFSWIDPSSNIDQTSAVPLVNGTAEDTFTPDEVGTWTVEADFGNGVVVRQTLDIGFMVIPESPIGIIALMGSFLAAFGGYAYLRQKRSV